MGTEPVLPGFQIKSVASKQGDAWVKQTAEHGEVFETPAGHAVKGVSVTYTADIPAAATCLTRLLMRISPSTSEYSVCRRICTKGGLMPVSR